MTNLEFITAALRLIGVVAGEEIPEASEARDAMQTMNDLFMEWDANDIDIGYFPQTTLIDESPIFVDAMLGARYNLAVVLAGEYGIVPNPAVVAISQNSYNQFVRNKMIQAVQEADVTQMPLSRNNWNIESDG